MTLPQQDARGFQDMNELVDALMGGGVGAVRNGVLGSLHYNRLNAVNALSNSATTAQAIFPTTHDAFTVEAGTVYRFGGNIRLNHGSTSHTEALGFALATATLAHISYIALASATGAADDTTAAAINVTNVDTNAATVVTGTVAAAESWIRFEGELVTTLGGTITPQITNSAGPTGTCEVDRGTFIWFQKIGLAAQEVFGNWG